MIHLIHEEALPPETPGEPCRSVDDCATIKLYYTYLGPDPDEREIGGPRSWVRTAGGDTYSVPTAHLTTAAPIACPVHARANRLMEETYVLRTRKPSTIPAGRKRRETKLDREARLARWEVVLS